MDATFNLPEVRRIISGEATAGLDMVVVYADRSLAETGYFIAEKFGAQIVLLSTFQVDIHLLRIIICCNN